MNNTIVDDKKFNKTQLEQIEMNRKVFIRSQNEIIHLLDEMEDKIKKPLRNFYLVFGEGVYLKRKYVYLSQDLNG